MARTVQVRHLTTDEHLTARLSDVTSVTFEGQEFIIERAVGSDVETHRYRRGSHVLVIDGITIS